jgi:Fusaric acid resistance protein-like
MNVQFKTDCRTAERSHADRTDRSAGSAGESDVISLNNPLDKPRLRFCLRATVTALLAFGLAHAAAGPLHGLWAVPTALVVMQMSIGGSLKAATVYVMGTIVGAAYAAAVAALVPHPTVLSFAGVLVLAVAPLAYAAAFSPSFRIAPVTAVLVLMISDQLGQAPVELALYRLLEVGIGSLVAIAVALLVFPGRAHALGTDAAIRVLEHMAEALPALMDGFRAKRDPLQNARLQDDIGEVVHALAEAASEAKPERFVHLSPEPDPAVLARTLLRLRHDLVMLGRAASAPLPESVVARLAPVLTHIGAKASDYFVASASALTSGRGSPPTGPMESAFATYLSEVASIRSDGLMEGLPADDRERIFALGFMLHQLQQNLSDLADCVPDWARTGNETINSARECGSKHAARRFRSMRLSLENICSGFFERCALALTQSRRYPAFVLFAGKGAEHPPRAHS